MSTAGGAGSVTPVDVADSEQTMPTAGGAASVTPVDVADSEETIAIGHSE